MGKCVSTIYDTEYSRAFAYYLKLSNPFEVARTCYDLRKTQWFYRDLVKVLMDGVWAVRVGFRVVSEFRTGGQSCV